MRKTPTKITLTAQGWFHRPGTGDIAAFNDMRKQLPKSISPLSLHGKTVNIDGHDYIVRSIEFNSWSNSNQIGLVIVGDKHP